MQIAAQDVEQLLREHRALMRDYGQAQTRCSKQLRAQAREIDRLSAQAIRLRAAVIRSETAFAWAREDWGAHARANPGLFKRGHLARRAKALFASIRDLLRDRLLGGGAAGGHATRACEAAPRRDDAELLEASLVAADLVICQTGCLSHGAYWRVQDHCKRTGKACVLVKQPDALRIVRIDKAPEGGGRTHIATLQAQ